jgi:hypothetical protein
MSDTRLAQYANHIPNLRADFAQAASSKQQAASSKQQAASSKQQAIMGRS